jgi:glucuronate isomerase
VKTGFIHDDFLLGNDAAHELYHRFAAEQPIIDYHNHLSPAQIAENHRFEDLGEAWLAGDHYKWRAMRANGVPESHITGNASSKEKFLAWARTVPYTLRNPLYHWTHLELARHFGITRLLDEESAPGIWEEANAKLSSMRVHDILAMHRVKVLCTTDDPADPLDYHRTIRSSGLTTLVLPTYRPDKALQITDAAAFRGWLDKLENVTTGPIRTFDDLLAALRSRHDEFHELGCRLSDYGLATSPQAPCGQAEAAAVFARVLSGATCTPTEEAAYASRVMHEIGCWNAERGWAMQLHLGALRGTNGRILASVGADAGCDSIGDFPQAAALAGFLDSLDRIDRLPRTILYNLNPADNYVFGAMAGNFQDGSIPGKIQFGSGWWFLDQKEGMEWQLNALSNLGLLRRFVGMLTDSRSFLSFPRHEYFRRVLCNLLGRDIESGELPRDIGLVGTLVGEVCYTNARDYFRFPGLC